MSEFKLRLRRYDPESGDAPYWAEYSVDLEGHRSVLEGILQAKGEIDVVLGPIRRLAALWVVAPKAQRELGHTG